MSYRQHHKSNTRWFLGCVLLLTSALTFGGPSQAQPIQPGCIIGPTSASTLLFPYFEVDPVGFGVTSLISINSNSTSSGLARVTLWTDVAYPTASFDIYLRAFDVVPINLRDVFQGNVPSTGGGVEFSPTSLCARVPPNYETPIGSVAERQQLIANHTGVRGPINAGCFGSATGDGIARGYITVDQVNDCRGASLVDSSFNPRFDSGYFADGGQGIANNNNSLWGDLVIVDPNEASAQGFDAVAIRADASRFGDTGESTFYGPYHGNSAKDNRMPLPHSWQTRFLNGGAFGGGASIIVWRGDHQIDSLGRGGFPCGELPAGYPLDASLDASDEDAQNLVSLPDAPVGLATQRVSIDEFDIPYPFGFLSIRSIVFEDQMWVTPILSAGGLFSAGYHARPEGSICSP